MPIIADARPQSETPLRLVLAELPDHVAVLAGNTLTLDAGSAVEDQLAAIADAATYLLTGRASWARRYRHLRAVPTTPIGA